MRPALPLRLLVPIAALAASGCLLETQSCTLLGCDDGVQITWSGAAASDRGVVTLDGVARPFDCAAANTLPVQCTPTGLRVTGRPVTVQIEVTTAAGVRRATLTPAYTATRPNGPDCEPVCYQATVAVP